MENPTGPLPLIDVFYIDVIGDRDADAQADNDSGTGSNPAVNDEAIGDSADDRQHLL